MKFFWKFKFIEESGSHSKIGILGCDKLPPIQGISPQDSGKLGMSCLWSEDKSWYDKKEMIEEIRETTKNESKILDNQRWNVDQGMIAAKMLW
jgi:hypothetical protein